jgi:hypothetical protein
MMEQLYKLLDNLIVVNDQNIIKLKNLITGLKSGGANVPMDKLRHLNEQYDKMIKAQDKLKRKMKRLKAKRKKNQLLKETIVVEDIKKEESHG